MTPTWLLLEVTAILVLALLGTRVARKSRAAVRHVLLSAAFAALLILPFASMIAPSIRVEVPAAVHAAIAPLDLDDPPPIVAARAAASEPINAAAEVAPGGQQWSWPSLSTLLVGGWITGTLLFLVPVIVGLWQVRSLRKSGLPWRNGGIAAGALARDAGIHRGVDVLLHESVPGPMTCGVIHPAIVLPADAATWPKEDLGRAIVHELEHVRRADWISHCLARVVAACYWFHPIVWVAWRQLVLEAERACDDAVLRQSEAADYADQLVVLAQRLSAASSQPLLAMANRRDLNTRVLAVLDSGQRRGRAGVVSVAIAAAACLLLVMTMSPIRIVSASAAAQDAAATARFDVVSIKPCPALPPQGGRGVPAGAAQVSPGYVHWDCVTLSQLIDLAYTGRANPLLNTLVSPRADSAQHVRGGPSWVASEKFTIEAKASPEVSNSGLPSPVTNLMNLPPAMSSALRAMLADRFQLKLRRATEQRPMYALTVAKGGLDKARVTPFIPGSCWSGKRGEETPPSGFENLPKCRTGVARSFLPNGNYRAEYGMHTFKAVALNLSSVMDRYVLDKTELEGQFSFAIEYAADDSTPGNNAVAQAEAYAEMAGFAPPSRDEIPKGDGPTIFKALESVGLKLEPTKGPAEYLLIESVQRPRPDSPVVVAIAHSGSTPDGSAPIQSAAASAQNATGQERFDVVSIKPCPDVTSLPPSRGAGPNLAQTSPGHVFWACVTLASLVDQAYAGWDFPLLNVQGMPLAFESGGGSRRLGDGAGDDGPKRVRGGPSWMYSERFTIEATASVNTISPPPGAVNLMRLPAPMNRALRAMLSDRFQLKLRRETEQVPMYALTVASRGLKIKPPAPGDCIVFMDGMPRSTPSGTKGYCGSISQTMPLGKLEPLRAGEDRAKVEAMPGPNRRIEFNGVTLQKVAEQLSGVLDHFVLDKSGVAGEFLFAFEFSTADNARGGLSLVVSNDAAQRTPTAGGRSAAEGRDQTIFQALEALGLKLELTKGPAEYLAIDSVQRPRPDNPMPARAAGAGVRR